MADSPSHEPLSGLDQVLFLSERDASLRAGGIAVFLLDAVPAWDDVEYAFERLSRKFLRFRQRVVEPTAGVGPAYWIVDPNFDIRYHVRRAYLPKDASLRTLLDQVEVEMMSPLELERPLWYATLNEWVDGSQSALVLRASHAIGDGLGGMQMMPILFDSSRDAPRRPMPPEPVGEELSRDDVAAETLRGLPRTALHGLRDLASSAGRVLRHPSEAASDLRDLADSLRALRPREAKPSPLLSGRSLSRRVLWTEISLSDLKGACHAARGSVNDGYLAALCGALRRYHDAFGTPIQTLPLVIPVSIRSGDDGAGENHFTGALLEAPIGEPDPVRRMREIHAQVQRGRDHARFDLTGAAAPLFSRLPLPLLQRLLGAISVPAIQASNVPGPTEELFLAGARVEKLVGIGPVPGMAMMAGLIGHGDTATVSISYDPAALRDAKLFQTCLEESFSEILALAPRGEEPRAENAPAE